MSKILLVDIETNGLYRETDRIHCICAKDYITKEEFAFRPHEIDNGVRLIETYDVMVAHNGVKFDRPVIQKLYPSAKLPQCIDTLICTSLMWPGDREQKDRAVLYQNDIFKKQLPPSMYGSQGLAAWGCRLGVMKGDFGEDTDWQEYSEEMLEYCKKDVLVLEAVYEMILKQKYSREALALEHQVAEIIFRQEQSGFCFNVEKAKELVETLKAEQEKLMPQIQAMMPPRVEEMKTPKYYKITTSTGAEIRDETKARVIAKAHIILAKNPTTKTTKKALGELVEKGPNKTREIPFNPGSRKQVAEALVSKYGWEPKKFTKKGQVEVSAEVLGQLDYPEAKLLAENFTLKKLLGQIEGGDKAWLKLVHPDGRIRGEVMSAGTITGRMRHMNPNVSQVPNMDSAYGMECRSLFHVPDGYKLVGVDANSLEAMMQSHYMWPYDGGEFARITTEGNKEDKTDLHSLNAKKSGLNRTDAKTLYYAMAYGAFNAKLGEIMGAPDDKKEIEGARVREAIMGAMPALARLIEDVTSTARIKRYITGLDGRILHIRKPDKALNTLLQSAGAVVMKKAIVILDQKLKDNGLVYDCDYWYCSNSHDESQISVRDADGLPELVADAAVKSIEEAGRHFKLSCEITGEAKIGSNWAQTH